MATTKGISSTTSTVPPSAGGPVEPSPGLPRVLPGATIDQVAPPAHGVVTSNPTLDLQPPSGATLATTSLGNLKFGVGLTTPAIAVDLPAVVERIQDGTFTVRLPLHGKLKGDKIVWINLTLHVKNGVFDFSQKKLATFEPDVKIGGIIPIHGVLVAKDGTLSFDGPGIFDFKMPIMGIRKLPADPAGFAKLLRDKGFGGKPLDIADRTYLGDTSKSPSAEPRASATSPASPLSEATITFTGKLKAGPLTLGPDVMLDLEPNNTLVVKATRHDQDVAVGGALRSLSMASPHSKIAMQRGTVELQITHKSSGTQSHAQVLLHSLRAQELTLSTPGLGGQHELVASNITVQQTQPLLQFNQPSGEESSVEFHLRDVRAEKLSGRFAFVDGRQRPNALTVGGDQPVILSEISLAPARETYAIRAAWGNLKASVTDLTLSNTSDLRLAVGGASLAGAAQLDFTKTPDTAELSLTSTDGLRISASDATLHRPPYITHARSQDLSLTVRKLIFRPEQTAYAVGGTMSAALQGLFVPLPNGGAVTLASGSEGRLVFDLAYDGTQTFPTGSVSVVADITSRLQLTTRGGDPGQDFLANLETAKGRSQISLGLTFSGDGRVAVDGNTLWSNGLLRASVASGMSELPAKPITLLPVVRPPKPANVELPKTTPELTLSAPKASDILKLLNDTQMAVRFPVAVQLKKQFEIDWAPDATLSLDLPQTEATLHLVARDGKLLPKQCSLVLGQPLKMNLSPYALHAEVLRLRIIEAPGQPGRGILVPQSSARDAEPNEAWQWLFKQATFKLTELLLGPGRGMSTIPLDVRELAPILQEAMAKSASSAPPLDLAGIAPSVDSLVLNKGRIALGDGQYLDIADGTQMSVHNTAAPGAPTEVVVRGKVALRGASLGEPGLGIQMGEATAELDITLKAGKLQSATLKNIHAAGAELSVAQPDISTIVRRANVEGGAISVKQGSKGLKIVVSDLRLSNIDATVRGAKFVGKSNAGELDYATLHTGDVVVSASSEGVEIVPGKTPPRVAGVLRRLKLHNDKPLLDAALQSAEFSGEFGVLKWARAKTLAATAGDLAIHVRDVRVSGTISKGNFDLAPGLALPLDQSNATLNVPDLRFKRTSGITSLAVEARAHIEGRFGVALGPKATLGTNDWKITRLSTDGNYGLDLQTRLSIDGDEGRVRSSTRIGLSTDQATSDFGIAGRVRPQQIQNIPGIESLPEFAQPKLVGPKK